MNPPLTEAVLGLACDRGAWPEAATAGQAACGTPVLGPLGLLRVVETALGLGGPEAPTATRLAAWRAKLEAAGAGRFWDESLAQDPLATAETLLAWRDGLVEAGWQAATTPAVSRLRDLAAAELAGPALPAGYPDRLAAALAELTSAPPGAPVARLRLLDAREHLPRGLERLVAALEAHGTTVATVAEPLAPALGDLGAAQDALRMGAGAQLTGDGRFALLTAETETAAAEALADWLAADSTAGCTAIIADRPTAALDAALARRGLPALGVSRASAQRGVLQLLPLALATRWRPFDAVRMLQLLQARPSPLPREIRHALANALVAAPGRGGPAWRAALTDGKAAFTARLATEETHTPTRKAAPRLARATARVAALVEAALEDPDVGMPVETLRALCGLLAAWASEQGRGEDPLFIALASAARTLAEAALASGRTALPRVELERLVGVTLENGVPDPAVVEEAAPWFLLRDPAGLWDYVDNVVWWGLGEPMKTDTISPSAIFRLVEERECLTLLIDEADTTLPGNEALRGILNSGFEASGAAMRNVQSKGGDWKPKAFATFCAVAIAGIGGLPPTLADRSVPIVLRRKMPDEHVATVRKHRTTLTALTDRLEKWSDSVDLAQHFDPETPGSFSDRQADISVPLLAIADHAGGDWPDRARGALTTLFAAARGREDAASDRIKLLTDLRSIFDAAGKAALPSGFLCERLEEMEDRPWPDFNHGRPIAPHLLARELKGFGIGPVNIRHDGAVPKGYRKADFEDAWARYVPSGASAANPPGEQQDSDT